MSRERDDDEQPKIRVTATWKGVEYDLTPKVAPWSISIRSGKTYEGEEPE